MTIVDDFDSFHITLSDLPQPGPWAHVGLCRKVPMPALTFFPERGGDVNVAKAICARCPVRQPCLTYALDAGQRLVGVWGGTSAKERRLMRRDEIEEVM